MTVHSPKGSSVEAGSHSASNLILILVLGPVWYECQTDFRKTNNRSQIQTKIII